MESILYALVAATLCHTLLAIPSPPSPEPIRIFELPLPPVAESTEGACTREINPHGTGCINRQWPGFQSGDFTPDGNHVIANVEFVGAPAAPAPASIYSGEQLILIKADGTNFTNGDPWKCLSCAVPAKNAVMLDPQRDYPHVYRNGDKALWGHNILDFGGELLQSDECTGDEIIYNGPSHESSNIDQFAVHVITGKVRRITSHPEYADPVAFSADDEWFVVMDTRGTDRQMWMSGMRQISPLIDLVTVTVASSTRNNGPRRFFQPILLDGYGDRDDYYGQRVNGVRDESNGSANDPNWNGRADPALSHDGTRITYWQDIVVAPQCGGSNPLKCPISTAQGGREYRIMVAKLTSQKPKSPSPVFKIPNFLPWAMPFPPGAALPIGDGMRPGNYILRGQNSGYAHMKLIGEPRISNLTVDYSDYPDDGQHFINGYENVTVTVAADNPWKNDVDWYSDIAQTGRVKVAKKTSKDGFHLIIDAVVNNSNAAGYLTTVINGKEYFQPINGT
ncbi:hypothetical protein NW762_006477 [Fusarium torreyae]|uniref:Saponin hydrolase n=1 Tax=Fusarium torreyae TaxID=1237075 RepID=A0A9W8VH79_9HYPO|nr:hypothetical protein NW762_006477 [Fusarium torreyae]